MAADQPATKQLIANCFAFLAGVEAPRYVVDPTVLAQLLAGAAPESPYPLDAGGFVRHWMVVGPFTARPGQSGAEAFAADLLPQRIVEA